MFFTETKGIEPLFHTFSTFEGRHCLYLEDLYVDPEHRGAGIGKALMKAVAEIAVERGCGRMEWSVLDWNVGAIRVYDAVGGKPQSEWIRYRLEDDTLAGFAAG